MIKRVLEIGKVPGDGKGDSLREAAEKINLNFDELYEFKDSASFKGPPGFTGSQGITGFSGSAGFDGSVGFTGSRGFAGDQGNTGFVGSRGLNGFTGSRGPTGFTGSQGQNYTISANTSSVASGSLTIDMTYGWTKVILTESVNNVTFINVPASGTVASTVVEFVQDATGGRTVTGTSFVTAGGVGLDLSLAANSTSLVSFITSNNGTTIFGLSAGKNWI